MHLTYADHHQLPMRDGLPAHLCHALGQEAWPRSHLADMCLFTSSPLTHLSCLQDKCLQLLADMYDSAAVSHHDRASKVLYLLATRPSGLEAEGATLISLADRTNLLVRAINSAEAAGAACQDMIELKDQLAVQQGLLTRLEETGQVTPVD